MRADDAGICIAVVWNHRFNENEDEYTQSQSGRQGCGPWCLCDELHIRALPSFLPTVCLLYFCSTIDNPISGDEHSLREELLNTFHYNNWEAAIVARQSAIDFLPHRHAGDTGTASGAARKVVSLTFPEVIDLLIKQSEELAIYATQPFRKRAVIGGSAGHSDGGRLGAQFRCEGQISSYCYSESMKC